jgi:DNA-binding transcriptional regulator LsrR (DeoR family)
LLVDILHRLRSVDPAVRNSFVMHLTREQIAHVTGMTPVHASRMWSDLIDAGLIECAGRRVTILAERRLTELAHFCDRDEDFDLDWLRVVPAESPAYVGAD